MKKLHKWILSIAIIVVLLTGASFVAIYVGTNILMGALLSSNMGELNNVNNVLTNENIHASNEKPDDAADAEVVEEDETQLLEPIEPIDVPAVPVDNGNPAKPSDQ